MFGHVSICTKANDIDVLLAHCFNKAWREFIYIAKRVVKAEFKIDIWLFINSIFSNEQVALC